MTNNGLGMSRRDGLLLAVIVGVGISLRLFRFSGYVMTDDVYYIERALALAQGDFGAPMSHWAARLGLVGPMALAFRYLGVAEWTAALFPFMCSLLSIGVTFVLGRRLGSTRVGLLAAALISTLPLEVVYASFAFPTTPITLLTGLAFVWFLEGEKHESSGPMVLAGMALGAAALVHETALICLVFLVPYAFLRRRIPDKWLLGVGGFLLVWGLDPLFHGVTTGDPFIRYRFAVSSVAMDSLAPLAPPAVPTLRPLLYLFSQHELGLVFAAAVTLATIGLRSVKGGQRPTAMQAAALWIVFLFLWISYGTVSLTGYRRLWLLPRMLAPLTIPACVLVAANVVSWRPSVRRGVVVALLTVSMAGVMVDQNWARSTQFDALQEVLKEQRPSDVFADAELLFHVRFYGARLAKRIEPLTPETLAAMRSSLGARPPGPRLLVTARPLPPGQLGRVTEIATLAAPNTLIRNLFKRPCFVSLVSLVRSPEQMEVHGLDSRPPPLRVYLVGTPMPQP
jgi:dolichyl-phosphate-mannose-protein mannosyltransferase